MRNGLLKNISVLIIEDNPGDYVLVEDYLLEKFAHIELNHCATLKDSISFFEKLNSDLSVILLDLNLPDENGIELVKKTLELASSIPVIVLTGYSDVSLAKQSLQLGVYDFLIKDELNPNLLYKSIDFAINRRYFISQIDREKLNFENLFNFNPQPTWLVDQENFQILSSNFAATKRYGYSLEEFQRLAFFDLHPQVEKSAVSNRILGIKEESKIKHFTHILNSGSHIKVDIYSRRVKTDLGDKTAVVQANNITDMLNYIETIELQNEKLKNIAWMQSHVLRAPLSRILGIINVIEGGTENSEELEFWLNNLKNSSTEMDTVVRKIVEDAKFINLNDEDE